MDCYYVLCEHRNVGDEYVKGIMIRGPMHVQTAFSFKCTANKLMPQNVYTVVNGMYGNVEGLDNEPF